MTSWPPYPPAQTRKPWYRNVWLWIGVYCGTIALGLIALAVVFVVMVDDGQFDDGYYVDQVAVNGAVAKPCRDMEGAAKDIRVFSSPADGAEGLRRFVTTSRTVPAAIDSVGEANESALQWRDDWTALLDALDAYADDLSSDPAAEFIVPTTDYGDSLMVALSYASAVECELPPVIVALDPDASDFW